MADDIVIRVEGLGKKYVIGHEAERERNPTLRDTVARAARNVWSKTRDMARGRALVVGDTTEEFWALKDVSFEVKRGEVLGIIGRNGAGKSTLLKVLSRITEPTEGRVTIEGRVASLLEVGTGFHPELSGRENVYLNGAILGMTRAEIRRKFDEIVDFSGVERFLDTPVKRYSSGMYVRLAFAVAAHLEPEILVVDEVLAVGDAEFQKKCLGKMQDVAGHGRTVLFVSHNLTAVQDLCSRAIVLEEGRGTFDGDAREATDFYLNRYEADDNVILEDLAERRGHGQLRFIGLTLLDHLGQPTETLATGRSGSIRLVLGGRAGFGSKNARIGITVLNGDRKVLFNCATETTYSGNLDLVAGSVVTCHIPNLPLGGGRYWLRLFLECDGVVEDWTEAVVPLVVVDASFFGTARNCPRGWEGRAVLVTHSWVVEEQQQPHAVPAE